MNGKQSRGSSMSFASFLRGLYTPKYIALNIVAALLYLLLFQYLVGIQNFGAAITFVPTYLIYAMAATSSILLTITVRSFNIAKFSQRSAGAVGTASMVIGGIVGGCGCSAPILLSFTALGVSTASVFSISNAIVANQSAIFAFMIAINIFAIIYYSKRISRAVCKVRK